MKSGKIIRIENDLLSTQYTMEHLEELGLIKMDFLGLRNLTIIDDIVQRVNQRQPLDIMKIPLDDARTYALLKKVDTVGIFQLESEGMKKLLKKLVHHKKNCLLKYATFLQTNNLYLFN